MGVYSTQKSQIRCLLVCAIEKSAATYTRYVFRWLEFHWLPAILAGATFLTAIGVSDGTFEAQLFSFTRGMGGDN